ncbi:deoxynucleoside kinase [Sporolactobacillus nakayamae]|uniref:Deoxyadenosine/deoxycytidine kinase n=1 Tax=Sporolactobacillus nakayamae TaxID=269670 RepID=A0A1I2QJD9_9BACL|nr:deoxynucleoside kinase [Sporolactobacillus nakayamae]SFG25826.1 deoxyadenosine/deoxycytidine kinase [Sporolactobacillus nakayamae]
MIESAPPSNKLISVAGMVGIGKTTFATAIANRLNYRTSFEKVDGNPYLDLFYKDFERWAFHLQIFFLGERFKETQKIATSTDNFIQDRSIYEDTGIFAKMHHEKGTMSDADYQTYSSLFQAMVMTPYFRHPNLLIYLHGSLDATVNRICQRGRGLEKETPRSYWREMFDRYEQWISHFSICPVLKINIDDYDVVNDPGSADAIAMHIQQLLNETADCSC